MGTLKEIDHGKKIVIDEIIKQNKKINNNLKSQVKICYHIA